MQSTTNYSMNLVEGTDIVNIPVQLNPNFQTIDGAMFDNKQASVGTATEVVTGTAHAIVRNNPDSDIFRFTATGAWTAGDTMSVDGNAVTVHLSDGTVPPTGAYIIGAEVLAVINSSLVTLMIGMTPPAQGVTSFNSRTGAVIPTTSDYDASMIDYDNTVSSLTSTDIQAAVDELQSEIQSISGSVNWESTEHAIGTWLDGVTTVYEKTVNFGSCPNSTSKTVAHGVSDVSRWIDIQAVMQKSDASEAYPLMLDTRMTLGIVGANIQMQSTGNFSAYDAYVTLRYTKNA